MKKTIILIGLLVISLYAISIDFNYTKQGFFDEGNEYAVQGYDPVSYFTENKAVKGKETFQLEYKGNIVLFKNQENLELFQKTPQKYAPQYGGYCAWRMAQDGKGVYGDPTLWKIVDKKLYFNYDKEIQERWLKNIPDFIKKADDFWLNKNNFKTLN
ncbi:hypothetical protein MNB_SUP05-5-480 [hydrothermal vent metagenome]|uniref:YHS domain-containing protein n=1 Tax=hydrothermal vent metagenome TaxID=652676 RepID=A0A1W1BRW4_9ZZZZ